VTGDRPKGNTFGCSLNVKNPRKVGCRPPLRVSGNRDEKTAHRDANPVETKGRSTTSAPNRLRRHPPSPVVKATKGFQPVRPPRNQRVKPLKPTNRGHHRRRRPQGRRLRLADSNPQQCENDDGTERPSDRVARGVRPDRDAEPAEQEGIRPNEASPPRTGRRTLKGTETQGRRGRRTPEYGVRRYRARSGATP